MTSTFSLAHGVLRRNFRLDLMLGSCLKQLISTFLASPSQPYCVCNSVSSVSKVTPCKGFLDRVWLLFSELGSGMACIGLAVNWDFIIRIASATCIFRTCASCDHAKNKKQHNCDINHIRSLYIHLHYEENVVSRSVSRRLIHNFRG